MRKRTFKFFFSLMLAVSFLFSVPVLAVGCFDFDGKQESSFSKKGVLLVGAPSLDTVLGEQEFYLPACIAVSANGEDISALVEISVDKQALIDREKGTIVFKENGLHAVTYSVVDPATNERLSHSFTIKRYREIFSFCNLGSEISQYAENSEQYVVSDCSGQRLGVFDLPASELYYAEAYFNEASAMALGLGMAHVEYSESADLESLVVSLIAVNAGMKNQFYLTADGELNEVMGASTSTQLMAGKGFKYAVARSGNVFYAFVNDKLVGKYVNASISGTLTVPGIVTLSDDNGDFVNSGGVKITKIEYFGGATAKSKLENLLDGKMGSDIEIDVGNTNWGDYDKPLN